MHRINVIGDSQSLRLLKYCGKSSIPLAVSSTIAITGCTTTQIRMHIKTNRPIMCSSLPCAIFVGTNDLKAEPFSLTEFRQQYLALVRLVRKIYNPTSVIIVALPEYPRYERNQTIINRIRSINQFIATLQRPSSTLVISWLANTPRNFFTLKYYNGRKDLIHLSDQGFEHLVLRIIQFIN